MNLNSSIGWIELSKNALNKLRRSILDKYKGVRDEMGVLAIHSGYADMFFPGTSVQHTRPKYMLFTCWNYLKLGKGSSNPLRDMRDLETKVYSKLKAAKNEFSEGDFKGLIGLRDSNSPDTIYWSALKKYRFYSGPDISELMGRWKSIDVVNVNNNSDAKDDQILKPAEFTAMFKCPDPPKGWGRPKVIKYLNFELSRNEAEFIYDQIQSVGPCLLTEILSLAKGKSHTFNDMWTDGFVNEAAANLKITKVLARAQKASQVAKLIRAVYYAQAEKLREGDIKNRGEAIEPPKAYRDFLRKLFEDVDPCIDATLKFDIDAFLLDLPRLAADNDFVVMLRLTKTVTAEIDSPEKYKRFLSDEVLSVYRAVEVKRKDTRAKLGEGLHAVERRMEIYGSASGNKVEIDGLNYRWRAVRDMLNDITAGLATRKKRAA